MHAHHASFGGQEQLNLKITVLITSFTSLKQPSNNDDDDNDDDNNNNKSFIVN